MIRAASRRIEPVLRHCICTRCFKRPPGSERLGDDVARSCESGCAIFENVPALQRIIGDADADPLADYDSAVVRDVCRTCNLSATDGRFCHRRASQTCPLARYGTQVMGLLEPLVLQHCGAD